MNTTTVALIVQVEKELDRLETEVLRLEMLLDSLYQDVEVEVIDLYADDNDEA